MLCILYKILACKQSKTRKLTSFPLRDKRFLEAITYLKCKIYLSFVLSAVLISVPLSPNCFVFVDGKICLHVQRRQTTTIMDKSPGAVVQYSYFSVISRFPHKTVHPFRTFLQFSLHPPYTKLKLGKQF